jgi:hypothetical protein
LITSFFIQRLINECLLSQKFNGCKQIFEEWNKELLIETIAIVPIEVRVLKAAFLISPLGGFSL